MGKKIDRTGEVGINNQGCKMKIIEYRNSMSIDIKFEDGTIVNNIRYDHFKDQSVKNNNYPEVFGIGFIGYGKYKANYKEIKDIRYVTWMGMLRRCYDEKYHKKYPTYIGCSVCEEWHNFQNFAKWYDENYCSNNKERSELDKDILIKGNKLYSPETCIFVPQRINSLFTKVDKRRGKCFIGVTKRNKKYVTRYQTEDNITYSRTFNTEIEAFNTYKYYKEIYIKFIAEEYRGEIPQKLYDAMYNYQVEITD